MARSSSRSPLVLVVVLALALGAAGFWVWSASRAPSTSPGPALVGPGDVDAADRARPEDPTELARPATAETTASPRTVAPVAPREVESAPLEAELADAWWVEGRIVFPEGTPLDERVVVVAQGREFPSKRLHKAPASADGRFRVAFSKQTKKAWLRLESRYVFLPTTVSVDAAKEPRDVELLPQLGGHVRGRLVPSVAAAPFARDLVGASLNLDGWSGRMSGTPRQMVARVADDLTFEFGGLDPDLRWRLTSEPAAFAPISLDSVPVASGQSLPLDLDVARGAELSGRVTDEAGAPVAGVVVRVDRSIFVRGPGSVEPKTDDQGRWKVAGLGADVHRVGFVKEGYVSGLVVDLELADGASKGGVDLVLTRGRSIRGVVTWADGTPAPEVRIEARRTESGDGNRWFLREDEPSARSGADGTFEIVGLEDVAWDLTAVASNKAAMAAEASAGKSAGKAGKSAKGRAQATQTNVAAGAADVKLVLGGGGEITGVVVDDAGTPVSAFGISVTRVIQRENWEQRESESTRAFRDEDGRFTIAGLAPGRYAIAPVGKSKFAGDEMLVNLPEDAAPLRLVLPRLTSVRGRVVDPSGAGVAGAEVSVSIGTNGSRTWRYDRETQKARVTNAQGEFAFEYPSGAWTVTAESASWAASEGLEVAAPPGGTVGPLALALRGGGTITGQALAADGQPAKQRQIDLHGGGESRETSTDAEGRFRFERVAPGSWTVTMQASREVQRAAEAKGNFDWNAIQPLNGSVEVTVADGGTEHVVLGGAPKEPVRITGTVRGPAPIVGANVSVARVKSDGNGWGSGDWRTARTDEEGHYEVTLDGAGEFTVNASRPNGGQANRRVQVAAGATVVVDFQMPTASISGVVLRPDGTPAGGMHVSARQDSARPGADAAGGETRVSEGSARTAANGTFTIEGLSAGTYVVTANPGMYTSSRSKSKDSLAGARVTGVVVADGARVTGVELRLAAGGVLRGRVVRADGTPAAGSQIVARTMGESGEDVSGWKGGVTDAAGGFEFRDLSAGRWSVVRIDGEAGEVAHVPRGADVRAGETTEVTLTVEKGARVTVRVFDASGAPVSKRLEVVDADGQDWGMLVQWPDDPGEPYVLTPLPRGTYRVSVVGVASAQSTFEVDAGGARDVRLEVPVAEPAKPK